MDRKFILPCRTPGLIPQCKTGPKNQDSPRHPRAEANSTTHRDWGGRRRSRIHLDELRAGFSIKMFEHQATVMPWTEVHLVRVNPRGCKIDGPEKMIGTIARMMLS
jgi:hypothetical protein